MRSERGAGRRRGFQTYANNFSDTTPASYSVSRKPNSQMSHWTVQRIPLLFERTRLLEMLKFSY